MGSTIKIQHRGSARSSLWAPFSPVFRFRLLGHQGHLLLVASGDILPGLGAGHGCCLCLQRPPSSRFPKDSLLFSRPLGSWDCPPGHLRQEQSWH